jgi:hypothetical protein
MGRDLTRVSGAATFFKLPNSRFNNWPPAKLAGFSLEPSFSSPVTLSGSHLIVLEGVFSVIRKVWHDIGGQSIGSVKKASSGHSRSHFCQPDMLSTGKFNR